MILCDTHTHTHFSFDGEQTADDICATAVAHGASRVALTDHYDIDCMLDGLYPEYDVKGARAEFEAAKKKYEGKLDFVFGIELGQPHLRETEAIKFIKENDVRFVIASVHNLENVPDFIFLKYDEMPQVFIENLFERYLNDVIRTTSFEPAHVIAHCTYPCRYINRDGRRLDTRKYFDLYRVLFDKMKERGLALELNTSGIRKKYGISPDDGVLRFYRECGGEIVSCGSDAHIVGDTCADVADSVEYLKSIGFKYLTVPSEDGAEIIKID